MTNLILCGGSGTRLWPVSRTLLPKQFVKLFDGKSRSLFQKTILRNLSVCDSVQVVLSEALYFLAQDQIEELEGAAPSPRYLLESLARNTAPAIALACLSLPPEEVVLVTPSDHVIEHQERYEACVQQAMALALEGYLVTFGVAAHSPHTGYGYIEANAQEVVRFHEKPDDASARAYLKQGNFCWNSGMFAFRAECFLRELKIHAPAIYEASLSAYKNAKNSHDGLVRIAQEDMAAIAHESVDYAVMEKSRMVRVVSADIGWSDLGSFESLYDHLPKDDQGNTLCEKHIVLDSTNNFVHCEERVVATIGVSDLIIVDTGDALLVARQGCGQRVKEIVHRISQSTHLHNIHLRAYRPWGSYTVLEDTPGYKIKRIEVKPGKRLSLQKHFHRNEHWIVVSGIAEVWVGDERYLVRQNESTYIKMGEVHRLCNPGKVPVVLIEAQVGEYTGEDDIVRIEDDFDRV